ncbi:sensor histidine kinase [Sphingobium sp. DC-2]|uniref:sensor histidine kinase n=1 Tax=Sphingobium sp. DC-2 TaxID=1303256 RepID=UPI00068B8C6E|nr:MEDS domain-containing protein [Sphingobium sp. DC-2]
MQVQTGIGPIGDVEWGTHFCHFYRDAEDLGETLIPFFKTGLEQGEAGLWVTAAPFPAEQAWSALNSHVDGLDQRIANKQIAIYGHEEWYTRYGGRSARDVAGAWIDSVQEALQSGYRGLRLTGNTAFLEEDMWDDFMDYEHCLRDAFANRPILALCSYNAVDCDSNAVLDVVQAHDFALARRRGGWEMVESASVRRSREALVQLNAELEQRIADRTGELAEALEHQRLLTAELSHRVKNSIATVQALVEKTLRGAQSMDGARIALRGRLGALSHIHDQLAAVEWKGVGLDDVLGAVLRPFGDQTSFAASSRTLNPRAAMDLALIFNELATNAVKYGALASPKGHVEVAVEIGGGGGGVRICWKERGGPPVQPVAAEGFGTKLIRQLVTHNLRGQCEIALDPAGLACTLDLPAKEILAKRPHCAHGCVH